MPTEYGYFTKEDVELIKNKVSDGTSLKNILMKEFPDVKVCIVRSLDTWSIPPEHYVKEAYLDSMKSAGKHKKIDGCNYDYVVDVSVRDLMNRKAYDSRGNVYFTPYQIKEVFADLEKELQE